MPKDKNHYSQGIAVLVLTVALMLLWPGLLPNLFAASGFMPHGHCYLWKPELVWLHLLSDLLIGMAYISISATLTYLVYKARQDIPFQWMFLAFGLFIISCGASHLMEVWTLWTPVYWLSGEIKLITAVVSITTAIALPPLVPQVLALIETAKVSQERKLNLEAANQELETLYERLRELDQIKTQFFANISHELRTPLALILGPTQKWLASGELSQDQRHDLEVVDRNARTLLKHVNDLLAVSKLEAGKMEINYSQVNLAQVVRLVTSHFDVLAEERQISFAVETPDVLPAQVDVEKLQRICFNLLSNAFKFTPLGGSIRCLLQTQPSESSEAEACKDACPSRAILTVEDSGAGVPPSLQEVIFEPFRQGEESPIRSFGGTGLGLAIVKDFVELHGGTIRVAQAPSGGASFIVELPLVAPPEVQAEKTLPVSTVVDQFDVSQILSELRQPQAESKTAVISPASLLLANNKLHPLLPLVLVVEDNLEMNRFISDTLAAEYRVVTAFNGQEGLEKAIALNPDLILSDVMMPKLSGEQLVQHIRKYPELDTTPIILLTAKANEALQVQMLRQGAQDYLTKPFSMEELRSRVSNLIAMKCAREILQQALSSQNQNLTTLANEVAYRKHELQHLAAQLEIRVEERTAELQVTNELLKQEITERQQAEAHLRLLESVVVNANDAILITEAEPINEPGPRILYVNAAFTRMTGYGLEEILGKSPRILQGPKSDRATLNKIRAALEKWQPIVVDLINYRKDGSEFWVEISLVPIADTTGWYTHWVAIQRDISERKQVEKQRTQLIREQVARAEAEALKWRFAFLAEASTLLAASLEDKTAIGKIAHLVVPSLADYCMIDLLEKDGSIRRVETVHIDPVKADLARELERRYPPDPNSATGIAKVLRTGKSQLTPEVTEDLLEKYAHDTQHLQLLRQINLASIMLVPLVINGQTLGVISLVLTECTRHYDLADLALAEDLAHRIALAVDNTRLYREAQEANRMKDEFLAILSHELRTPLNAILGWVQLLRTRQFDAKKTAQAFETIERNARSQTKLVDDLLDVSRIIQGKLQLKIQAIDLIPVIEGAIQAVKPAADVKAIQINCLLDSSVGMVSGDAERLQQIVWNLLSNAIKFTPPGGDIEVRLSKALPHQAALNRSPEQMPASEVANLQCHSTFCAQIQVTDTGNGISPEFLPYVFDRFRQENSSTTRSHGGLGLGLAIVRNLVELHGGSVYVASPGIGQGATFAVSLPLLDVSSPVRETMAFPSSGLSMYSANTQPLHQVRVLVVDDEADNLELIALVLRRQGAEVTAVASVKEALSAIAQQRPDVLVSDIGLPGEDGYFLIRQVRQQEAETNKALPAIALTAYARESDQQLALAAGFQLHIPKPVEPEQLVKVVAQLASRAKKVYRRPKTLT